MTIVPFGPFLAAGTMTAILVGSAILDWYSGSDPRCVPTPARVEGGSGTYLSRAPNG